MKRRSFFAVLAVVVAVPKVLIGKEKPAAIGTDPKDFDGLQIGKMSGQRTYRVVLRTRLPSVQWRKVNEAVQPSRPTFAREVR